MTGKWKLAPGEAVEIVQTWVQTATHAELEQLRTAIELWPDEHRKMRALEMIDEARPTLH